MHIRCDGTICEQSFILVVCADHQQSKLILYWGNSLQPGMTYYYLQKMSYNVFGIVDCRDDQGYVYLAPETIGSKNTDHDMHILSLTPLSVSLHGQIWTNVFFFFLFFFFLGF